MAAEQKARLTYDNILRLVKDPEIADPIRFLREREIVHFQRFGEMRSCKYRMNETHATSMPSTHRLIKNHAKIVFQPTN